MATTINRLMANSHLKNNTEIDEIRSLLKTNGLPDTEKDAQRIHKFRLSTDHVDRYDTVFSLRSWNLINYRANPVFLYQHNRDCMADSIQMPVGRSIKEWIEAPKYRSDQLTIVKEFKRRDGSIVEKEIPNIEAHTRLIPRDSNNDPTGLFQLVYFPDEKNSEAVYKAYNTRLLNAVSVGAKVDEKLDADEVEDVQRELIGFKEALFTKAELFEGSAVTLPGNPQAVKMSLDAGYPKEFLSILGIDTVEERFGNIRGVIRTLEEQGPDLLKLIRSIPELNKQLIKLSQDQDKIIILLNELKTLTSSKRQEVKEDAIIEKLEKIAKKFQ